MMSNLRERGTLGERGRHEHLEQRPGYKKGPWSVGRMPPSCVCWQLKLPPICESRKGRAGFILVKDNASRQTAANFTTVAHLTIDEVRRRLAAEVAA